MNRLCHSALLTLRGHTAGVVGVAYSPDGNSIAVGNVDGEVRIYKTSDGSRLATLKENKGAVFALKFHPTKNQLGTGGYDGKVRIFEVPEGKLMTAFDPVPIGPSRLLKNSKNF